MNNINFRFSNDKNDIFCVSSSNRLLYATYAERFSNEIVTYKENYGGSDSDCIVFCKKISSKNGSYMFGIAPTGNMLGIPFTASDANRVSTFVGTASSITIRIIVPKSRLSSLISNGVITKKSDTEYSTTLFSDLIVYYMGTYPASNSKYGLVIKDVNERIIYHSSSPPMQIENIVSGKIESLPQSNVTSDVAYNVLSDTILVGNIDLSKNVIAISSQVNALYSINQKDINNNASGNVSSIGYAIVVNNDGSLYLKKYKMNSLSAYSFSPNVKSGTDEDFLYASAHSNNMYMYIVINVNGAPYVNDNDNTIKHINGENSLLTPSTVKEIYDEDSAYGEFVYDRDCYIQLPKENGITVQLNSERFGNAIVNSSAGEETIIKGCQNDVYASISSTNSYFLTPFIPSSSIRNHIENIFVNKNIIIQTLPYALDMYYEVVDTFTDGVMERTTNGYAIYYNNKQNTIFIKSYEPGTEDGLYVDKKYNPLYLNYNNKYKTIDSEYCAYYYKVESSSKGVLVEFIQFYYYDAKTTLENLDKYFSEIESLEDITITIYDGYARNLPCKTLTVPAYTYFRSNVSDNYVNVPTTHKVWPGKTVDIYSCADLSSNIIKPSFTTKTMDADYSLSTIAVNSVFTKVNNCDSLGYTVSAFWGGLSISNSENKTIADIDSYDTSSYGTSTLKILYSYSYNNVSYSNVLGDIKTFWNNVCRTKGGNRIVKFYVSYNNRIFYTLQYDGSIYYCLCVADADFMKKTFVWGFTGGGIVITASVGELASGVSVW